MVDERDFDGMLQAIWKSLGRVEQGLETVNEKVDEVKATAKENMRDRDVRFAEQGTKPDARRGGRDPHRYDIRRR